MFEYWFIGLTDDQGKFDHHGTTADFLEVVCRIAETFTPEVAGDFTGALLEDKQKKLTFLRVVDWKFSYGLQHNDDGVTIKLQKGAAQK